MSKRYPTSEKTLIKRLRLHYKPAEIAQMTGRTEGAIKQILYHESLKGVKFPKLRHGRLKYDSQKANEWRELIRAGLSYQDIKTLQNVNPVIISRVLAADSRGELRW
jgi:hypothetical protein